MIFVGIFISKLLDFFFEICYTKFIEYGFYKPVIKGVIRYADII